MKRTPAIVRRKANLIVESKVSTKIALNDSESEMDKSAEVKAPTGGDLFSF